MKDSHRFSAHGLPVYTIFSAVIPFKCIHIKRHEHKFHLKAEVIEGDNPLLIGLPALLSMQATFILLQPRSVFGFMVKRSHSVWLKFRITSLYYTLLLTNKLLALHLNWVLSTLLEFPSQEINFTKWANPMALLILRQHRPPLKVRCEHSTAENYGGFILILVIARR